MILIVDTNIVFAALLKNSKTRELLIDSPLTLYAPETMLSEIRKHQKLILEKSGLSEEDFEILFDLVTENITIIEKNEYSEKIPEAEKIIGSIDKGDIPFIALALSKASDGVWTENIQHFKKQNRIRVWTTKEILSLNFKT